ncbi:hypothetical protein [Thermomonospora umbrina]|nr:hypothetical protein [Thermomonospora umbrina]
MERTELLFETRGGCHLVIDIRRDGTVEDINAAVQPCVEQGREWSDFPA